MTRLRIELKLNATPDEVMETPGIMEWLVDIVIQCAIFGIEMTAWLDDKRLDISVHRVGPNGEKPS